MNNSNNIYINLLIIIKSYYYKIIYFQKLLFIDLINKNVKCIKK